MKRPANFRCIWDGEHFSPVDSRAHVTCQREFGEGEIVTLERNEERSQSSHSHYFACLHEAFLQLPERYARRFRNEEYLRAWALVKAGYCNERTLVCGSAEAAQVTAAFIAPFAEYAVITVQENVITVYTAKSQSRKAMGNKDFQASKDAVLQILADLVGISPDHLAKNAGKAA